MEEKLLAEIRNLLKRQNEILEEFLSRAKNPPTVDLEQVIKGIDLGKIAEMARRGQS